MLPLTRVVYVIERLGGRVRCSELGLGKRAGWTPSQEADFCAGGVLLFLLFWGVYWEEWLSLSVSLRLLAHLLRSWVAYLKALTSAGMCSASDVLLCAAPHPCSVLDSDPYHHACLPIHLACQVELRDEHGTV